MWVWSLVSHVEAGHRLRMFENMVLRRIFGLKGDGEEGKTA
jgi:hypothetical protein